MEGETQMKTLFAICGATGSGKTELVHALLRELPSSTKLISATTRPPRSGEENGIDYDFVKFEDFKKTDFDILEYDEYNGNFYFTRKSDLAIALHKNKIVFAILTPNGIRAVKKTKAIRVIALRIVADNPEEQLRQRAKDTNETESQIYRRIQILKNDLESEIKLIQDKLIDIEFKNEYGKFNQLVNKVANFVDDTLASGA